MSFYIVEKSEQLQNIAVQDSCFIYIIPLNNLYHPNLTTPSLIYYRGKTGKGYIICIDHSESLNKLKFDQVSEFIQNHKNIYTLDVKRHLYYLPGIKLHDINFNRYIDVNDFNTKTHNYFYSKYKYHDYIEKIIPITKQHEKFDNLYQTFTQDDFTRNSDYDSTRSEVFHIIERTGIPIDTAVFHKTFELSHESASIKNSVLYGAYNLYNITTRPTNKFNGINLSALTKPSRACFIPKNDIFLEFDYTAYHPMIIARKINYIPAVKTAIYEELRQCMQLETVENTKESVFRQLYGGIEDKYKDVEFFKKTQQWIDQEWQQYKQNGYITLQGGKLVHDQTLSKNQVFNYIIQSIETYNNVEILQRILPMLEKSKTKLLLVNYDSFLFDLDTSEKDLMVIIKSIISETFPIKISYGKNYRDMQRIENF